MKIICAWCRKEIETVAPLESEPQEQVSHGICPSCRDYFLSGKRPALGEFLNSLEVPVLVVNAQGEVLLGNGPALVILGKSSEQVAGLKGGDAMECVNARLPGGCGNTLHCKACTIRNSVMETFATGQDLQRVPAYLNRRNGDGAIRIRFLISTQKADDVVLLRIDEVGQAGEATEAIA